jgi:para-aminobenzoate synthetase/4-amino-4-deoxychorismate lyase
MVSVWPTLPAVVPSVRFDDLTPGSGASFALEGWVRELVATDQASVIPTIAAAEKAAEAGYWVAGWIGYEAAPAFDEALPIRPADTTLASRLPLAWFGVYRNRRRVPPPGATAGYDIAHWVPSVDPGQYERVIGRIRERIAVGDTYQVNYSFRMRGRLKGDDLAFYSELAHAQRGAYAAHIDVGEFVVASASPELFFSMEDGWLTTRPMKGTATRGRWKAEDLARADAMLGSTKERAENLMIVDLLRNDMGRISEFGSVAVERLFAAERYETVWQMTSTITSRLRPNTGFLRVLEALFPCGSVTGAPKASTMGIIAELEATRRGVYCGAVGWLAPGGRKATFNVAIRTAAMDRSTGEVEYGVGGGITWDSKVAGEHREALAKAKVLTVRRPSFDLLETLRWEGTSFWELEAHLTRLADSAEYFRFLVDRDHIRAVLTEAGRDAGPDPARLRLTVDEYGQAEIELAPLQTEEGPVRVAVDEDPVDPADPMLYHKTTVRTLYEDRLARHPWADDVILVNRHGEVTETTIGNLVVRIDDRWYTPPLESGLLPGVYRARLLAEGKATERRLTPDDVMAAGELAVVNSVRLWRPAVIAAGGGSR